MVNQPDIIMEEGQLHQLISKYLSGTATGQEREQVLAWYREHNAQTVEWPAEQEDERQQIKKRVLAHLHQHIQQEQKNNYHFGRWLVAASIFLISTFAYLYRTNISDWLLPVKQQYAVTILPNQRAVYVKQSGTITKQDYPDAEKMLARRDGNYQYDSVPLNEVIADLRHNYNLNIVIYGDIGNCKFYGRLKPDESPEKFLKKMCMIMNATLVKQGNTYIITGGGCMN